VVRIGVIRYFSVTTGLFTPCNPGLAHQHPTPLSRYAAIYSDW